MGVSGLSSMQLLICQSGNMYRGQPQQVTDMLCDAVDKIQVEVGNKRLLQAEDTWPSGVEKRFGLIVSLCTRGQDGVSDCVAPQLSPVCHATPLMAIYCFLNPENGRPRTTEFQPLFSTSFPV